MGGFIVKYMGDGIMALCSLGMPMMACRLGIDKLNQVKIYNAERVKVGRFPIGVGIGVNTGQYDGGCGWRCSNAWKPILFHLKLL